MSELCNHPRCQMMREHTPDECGWPEPKRESPPLAERVQAALTDDKLREAAHAYRDSKWSVTADPFDAKGLAAMRAVLLAALAPTTPPQQEK